MAAAWAEGGTKSAAPRGGTGPSPGVFEQLGSVADAVLYEGYLLYPYRRSSTKNRVRWQFGVLFPRDWVEADGPVTPGVSGSADSWYQQTECLLRVRQPGSARVRVRVRHLQMQRKQVQEAGHRPVESLRTGDGTVHLTFDEALPRECEVEVPLDELLRGGHTFAVGAAAGEDVETLPEGAGRVVRTREELRAETTVTADRLSDDLCRIRVRTTNTAPAPPPRTTRDEALRRALIATHTLLGGDGAEFVSLIDPPAGLEAPVRACRNEFTFPVLGGEAGDTGPVVLSAPIILPDHPQVAPESPGDLHDAAEIDEILTLRTMLLTDEEKREARATDPRAAAILDRVDTMPQEVFERLHGAVRSLTPATPTARAGRLPDAVGSPAPGTLAATPADRLSGAPVTLAATPADRLSGAAGSPAPATPTAPADRPAWWQEGADDGLSPASDTVLVDGVPLGGGSRVRLRPRGRGADAQDMFLAGRTAEVAAVFHDVDGSVHLAVTLDDDPAAELNNWYGRFHYFRPDELEPLGPAGFPDEPSAPAPAAAPARHTSDSETPAAEAE
ncbi:MULTISPECIES: hypothetical protein [Streptomyces]|uniref:Uncharacterized protein n=2 Tax=Streptomyces TaxID=1883 RepID=A0AA89Q2X1_STRCU|nr:MULTISPECIES: hypothetical protein [Streptomyces]MBB5809045.1 hypothetical protein [Streptomyces collinus]MEC7052023.1 hypothetical protein [Streptomyces violaceochromogenes]WMX62430.1 hypothetical protein RFN52_03295 [Streptomyces collinus]GHC91249.1 hypothetical protein GCM10010309_73600 [Streptomyces violaceochromogenes]